MIQKKIFIKSYRFLQVLTGIVYVFMAILAMRYNNEKIIQSVQIMGVFSLIKGFFEIMNKEKISKRTNHKQMSAIVLGVVDIIVGIVLVTNITLSLTSLSILFGVWFIGDAVISFFMLDLAKSISTVYYVISLIIDLICGLIGLILVIASTTSIISVSHLISYYFLLFGFLKVVGGVINKEDLHSLEK
ncbi:DUF308 domain-containing protein [Lactococcus lactis]|uniref:DUF308 domain-containing protein n=1 Tax=Lactococcus lactis TaxID=1358 RepID=UPI000513132A|nr:DUF308 domain-containing protein [Lactococcus lactis]KGF77808.1 integral membrane protein [Lactococcus lactis]